MNCRHCGGRVDITFIDLGTAPLSNAFVDRRALNDPEVWYPLRVMVCERCWLVQTQDYAQRQTLFADDYVYFSSYADTWLRHAERYVEEMVGRLELTSKSLVVEVASNDGYLLQFVKQRGIPCLGIEPTRGTAHAAQQRGIEVIVEFFGKALAERLARAGYRADLIVANNVLAHVPDINDFVAGFPLLMAPEGVVTFEFPHLLRLIERRQFDTIYHEHFSYLSLTAVIRILKANGLAVFDVQEIDTHGGSLRVFAMREGDSARHLSPVVQRLLEVEETAGLVDRQVYDGFQSNAYKVKDELLEFLLNAKRCGNTVLGYGAAAKGNTLLNFAGVRADLVSCVADKNPAKVGKFLPGSRIPVAPVSAIGDLRPDYVLILPWNLRDEIMEQLGFIREWGGRFVTAIPELTVQ